MSPVARWIHKVNRYKDQQVSSYLGPGFASKQPLGQWQISQDWDLAPGILDLRVIHPAKDNGLAVPWASAWRMQPSHFQPVVRARHEGIERRHQKDAD